MREQPAGWNSNSDVEHLGPRAVTSGGGVVVEKEGAEGQAALGTAGSLPASLTGLAA